jgi:hypothetical protein
LHPIRLISFGYLHLPASPDGTPIPPTADRVEDVRERLRDPATARVLRDAPRRAPHHRHRMRRRSLATSNCWDFSDREWLYVHSLMIDELEVEAGPL